MKTKTVLLLFVVLAFATQIASAADSLAEAFQKGLLEEEANRNLDAAIQAYQSVLKQLDEQRKLAATTIFRLGECYRKLGKTNEAIAQYQRVLREFPDQDVLAKLSQQNLGALGGGGEAKPKRPDLLAVSFPDEETLEIERLKKMIKDSPDLINAFGPEGTPLQKAARKGQVTVVKFLLENGADPNTGALPLAAEAGHRAMVELLLAHGADVNSTYRGETALHKACNKGFRSVAEVLIAAKADLNATFPDLGYAPLHYVVGAGNRAFVELLLAHGADPNVRNKDGQTPLHSPGNAQIAALLLAKKADVNAADNSSRSPLYRAVESGAVETAEVLLKNGADVNARISSYFTRGATRPARIGSGELNNAVPCNGFTPLHLAALMGNVPSVNLLLAHKADVNARASQELTPLNLAVTYSTPEVVKALLEGGADVNAVPAENPVPPIIEVVLRQSEEMVSAILARKPSLEQRDPRGMTALQTAAGSGNMERITELLLEAGADPNVTAEQDGGATPLHWAISNRNRRIVEALLKHKANPNVANTAGRTPLDYAKTLVPQSSARGRRTGQTVNPRGVTSGPGSASGRRAGAASGPLANQIASDILQLLRTAGATEYPQRPNSIMIGRGDVYSVVFSKDSRSENRYTLMEAVGMGFKSYVSPSGSPTAFTSALSFPDFSQVRILRGKSSEGAGEEEITVDLEKALQTGDCAKDIALRWGDLVEIPEKEHKVSETWLGLPFEVLEPLRRCLQRSIYIRVMGKSGQNVQSQRILDLFPNTLSDLRAVASPQGAPFQVRSFRLDEFLHAANVLLNSSDLTRVKILRTDPDTKQATETMVNLFDPSQSFWLRHGDNIEVPEKE